MKLRRVLLTTLAAGTLWPQLPSSAMAADLPYRAAGLSDREAAIFLLDRLTYGARPGDVEQVLAMGIDAWLDAQLVGSLPEPVLEDRLDSIDELDLDPVALAARFPNSSQMSAHLRRFHPGLIPPRDEPILDFSVVAAKIAEFRRTNGFQNQDVELHERLLAQKLLRAIYAENQLREVLTDFWFNHFFVSTTSFNARLWVLPYEQYALRPQALGPFHELLNAVAKHPAMRSFYVGNELPSAFDVSETTTAAKIAGLEASGMTPAAADAVGARATSEIVALEYDQDLILSREFWPATGPNPEYARVLLSLQTLGPDANYSADDLDGVARAFTGWSVLPVGASPQWFERGIHDALNVGFVRDGHFLFRADWHDARPKYVLGREFPAGGGVEEGEQILDLLAAHEATAHHIARKLAARFVNESPSRSLVRRIAAAFGESGGDIATAMRALVTSSEFWNEARSRSKVKTPLEYVASAIRVTNADIDSTGELAVEIARMGQPLYAYRAPTGYPDENSYWLDSASFVHRLNFAVRLVENRITGVAVDKSTLTRNGVGSPDAIAAALLPGRRFDTGLEAAFETGDSRAGMPNAATAAALVIASPDFQLR